MTVSAHAVGFIDTREAPPRVTSVCIYSAAAGDVATDQQRAFPFDICEVHGADYGEASAAARELLEKFYPWAFKLLSTQGAIQ